MHTYTGYYPLIAKAVTGVQSPQDRRAIYERGRNALVAELRAIKPRLATNTIRAVMSPLEHLSLKPKKYEPPA